MTLLLASAAMQAVKHVTQMVAPPATPTMTVARSANILYQEIAQVVRLPTVTLATLLSVSPVKVLLSVVVLQR